MLKPLDIRTFPFSPSTGKPYDRTVDWTDAAAACRAASIDSSQNCTVTGTLNVSSSATLPGEWEIDLCFHSFWDLPLVKGKGISNTVVGQKKGFCLRLVQHKAAMPGIDAITPPFLLHRCDDSSSPPRPPLLRSATLNVMHLIMIIIIIVIINPKP